jgi:hypothetical protein
MEVQRKKKFLFNAPPGGAVGYCDEGEGLLIVRRDGLGWPCLRARNGVFRVSTSMKQITRLVNTMNMYHVTLPSKTEVQHER